MQIKDVKNGSDIEFEYKGAKVSLTNAQIHLKDWLTIAAVRSGDNDAFHLLRDHEVTVTKAPRVEPAEGKIRIKGQGEYIRLDGRYRDDHWVGTINQRFYTWEELRGMGEIEHETIEHDTEDFDALEGRWLDRDGDEWIRRDGSWYSQSKFSTASYYHPLHRKES